MSRNRRADTWTVRARFQTVRSRHVLAGSGGAQLISQRNHRTTDLLTLGVDVLRVRVIDWVDRQLNRTVVVLKSLDARIPKNRQ